MWLNITQLKLGNIQNYTPVFQTVRIGKGENMLRYLALDIICSLKLTVFLKLRSRKTVLFLEQIMSADK